MSQISNAPESTPATLLRANLHEVFANRDAAARRRAIESTYTEDVIFTDPDGPVTGWDALEERAAGLLAQAPDDFAFEDDGPAYTDSDTGALAWRFGPTGAPVARGIDIITVRAGRIAQLRTILLT